MRARCLCDYYSTANWKLNRQFYQIKQSFLCRDSDLLNSTRSYSLCLCLFERCVVCSNGCRLFSPSAPECSRYSAHIFADADVDLNLFQIVCCCCFFYEMLKMVRAGNEMLSLQRIRFGNFHLSPCQTKHTFLMSNRHQKLEPYRKIENHKNRLEISFGCVRHGSTWNMIDVHRMEWSLCWTAHTNRRDELANWKHILFNQSEDRVTGILYDIFVGLYSDADSNISHLWHTIAYMHALCAY